MTKPWKFITAIVLCEAVGGIGSLFTTQAIPTWYAALAKPAFSPPNWLFAPVWILLYALMGIAFVVMHERIQPKHERLESEAWFFVQLALNALWTPVFFGLHSPGLGLLVIVALWIAIIGTMLRFQHVSKLAAWLLVPYLAWVSFAMLLNFALWRMN